MQKLAELTRFKAAQNIILKGFDPVSAGGFTQVPNMLLNDNELTAQAKLAYAKLLSYAWHNERVFPGQDRMAEETGVSQPTITRAVKELKRRGWVEIQKRGQGKTNVYILKHTVKARR